MALLLLLLLPSLALTSPSEEEAVTFLRTLDEVCHATLIPTAQVFRHYANLEMTARWGYITNITQENEAAMVSQPMKQPMKQTIPRTRPDWSSRR